MSDLTVKHRVYVNAPVSKVFSMLTSGDGWTRWFTQSAYVEPEPGGKIAFEWAAFGPDHVSVKDQGKVTEIVQDKKFAFTWHPGKHPTVVTLSFEPRGSGCVIDLQESGYTYEQDDVCTALDVAAGWGEAMTLFKFYVEEGSLYGSVPAA